MAGPSDSTGFRTANFQKIFDSVHPMLVQACGPVAKSFDDIESRYDISVEAAELEVSFVITASSGVMLAETKQNASMTVKLILKPDKS